MKPITVFIFIFLQLHNVNDINAKSNLHSTVDLKRILRIEKLFIGILDNFVTSSIRSIHKIKASLRNQIEISNLSFIGKQKFMIKIRSGLRKLQNYKKRSKNNFVLILKRNCESMPTLSDVENIVKRVQLIQRVYNITAANFVDGKISQTIRISSKLSLSDCLRIGLTMSGLKFNSFASDWLHTALSRLNQRKSTFISEQIDEFKIKSELISLKKQIIDFHRKDDENFRDITLKEFVQKFRNGDNDLFESTHSKILSTFCQRAQKNKRITAKKLICQYQMKNHPFLKLAPLKTEIYNWDPYIVVFHDVISNDEIKVIKNISSNNLLRGKIFNFKTQMGKEDESRISNNYFIKDDDHPLIKILNQRVSDMSGLSTEYSEIMQVGNYGIGGYYGIHHDFFNSDVKGNSTKKFPQYWLGDRIATVLFYMSNVKYGGATIWPFINTSILPKKGSAVLWFNLYKSGLPNFYTLHSSCPVVIGSKWILTKWLRSKGQEFRKPCGLYPDHDYKFFSN
ncbi:prolyl 4-hydroxylase subunit alpha-1-like [Condylostylus longicornis]|uniref:prolyl 4-hydroxylase subunit alpha-1-like n=1 Tax=Condylostylus longicornis TaxID=2530218 RepID=UPI00244E0188|nr:prolyl 4-hydroxylase subunit alpha-1-like [Condylostylus longicornis]